MTIEDEVFKRYSVNFEKLIKYGFIENKGNFNFSKLFKNDEFRTEIIISKTGKFHARIYEVESNDEFLPLRVENQQGTFIGEVREEYKNILRDIRDNCYSPSYFIFPQSNRITNLIISKYGDNPVFMWVKFPGFGVFKNSANNKWYGAIMNINYYKLGDNNNKPVEILNIKLNKEKIQDLLKQNGFYPAWHMNKKSWITITLDETLSDEKIFELIEESYSYTLEKQRSGI